MSYKLERLAILLAIIVVAISFAFFSKHEEQYFEHHVNELKQNIANDRNSPEAMQSMFNLGLYYEKNGRYQEAYETFKTVREEYHAEYGHWDYSYLHDEALWKIQELKKLLPPETVEETPTE